MIKTVIFDIDGTLYNFDIVHNIAINKVADYVEFNIGIKREDFFKEHNKIQKSIEERLGSNNSAIHNRLIRYQILLENFKIDLFPHSLNMYNCYWNTLIENLTIEYGLIEYMNFLNMNNIRIGLGTNMTAYIQYKKILKLGIEKYIDFIVTSEEAGFEKPSKEFFEYCLTKSYCKTNECLFIGDSLKNDYNAALNVGMNAILYNNISYFDILEKTKAMI